MSSSYVPNPNCCTDPRYLCPRCSTAACEAAGIVVNAQDRLFRRRRVDPNDILPMPKIDWTLNQERTTNRAECGCSKSHVTNVRIVAGLPIQKPDWVAWSSER